MTAYYNEHDPFAAAWLRQLIDAGHIAPGVVDERSIEDVLPDELAGFTQCHFFAGIGVWSYALRRAGWDDDRPVWTGSCPCQPFSAAGKGTGISDERHLWPAFHHLIDQCRPPVIFGEQVASRDGLAWLDLVHADLEGTGYAFGAVDLCAAGFGAPHIRRRLFFVADATRQRCGEAGATGGRPAQRTADGGAGCRLDNNNNKGLEGLGRGPQAEGGWVGAVRPVAEAGESGGLGNAGLYGRTADTIGCAISEDGSRVLQPERPSTPGCRPSPTNGFWRDADWIYCRDGKWRPVESGTFPLVDGTPNRVGRLRGYGNAIVAPVAEAWIRSYL